MLNAIKTHWLAFIAIILVLAFPVVLPVTWIVGKVSSKASAKLASTVDGAAGTTEIPTAAGPPASS